MLIPVLTMLGLLAATDVARAQQCLHGRLGTMEDRTRRERALEFARRVNAVQALPSPGGPRYRPLEELPMLPAVPEGFDLQFHTDGRSYTLLLKDRRDPCRFAVFSDQEGTVYAAVPQPPRATVLPLETR
ncbi:MAG: hypothetical protein HYU37_22625 [Acidobacteria bacterium]|nr:hypothetical protein [Acidobacteriota bacterium]